MGLHWCAWDRGCGNDDSNPALRLLALSRYSPNRHLLFLQGRAGGTGAGLDWIGSDRQNAAAPRGQGLAVRVSGSLCLLYIYVLRAPTFFGRASVQVSRTIASGSKTSSTARPGRHGSSVSNYALWINPKSSPTATGYPHIEICAACESVAQDDAHLQHLRYATDQATRTPPRPKPRSQC